MFLMRWDSHSASGGDIQLGLGFGWFVGEGVGDGRSGTLGQGREASLRLPHVSLLCWTREAGCLVHKTLGSTIRRNGSTNPLPSSTERNSPMVTTVESHKGSMALSQALHWRAVIFRWAMRIALTRTRRVNGASSRPVSQAYMLLRVDGPSITCWLGGG